MNAFDVEVHTHVDYVQSSVGPRTTEAMRLTYSREDPLAVSLHFEDRNGPFRWVVARQVLSDGVKGRSGDGDVQVWPWSPTGTAVALTSPEGSATFVVLTSVLAGFLRRTQRLVSARREAALVDAAIDAMLAEVTS